ncbi:hypothetical protein BDV96DRAFT_584992 [Lophiotrema nucula]|uniref:Uncharacterized protein n=1 Tax=Lophiotrema nucula TaxID=690887 RepID=A0A6A5YTY1_9PLEO|nr:hypothetical protein BDV96DRAFT_584992 [Lophiotrema nucula]
MRWEMIDVSRRSEPILILKLLCCCAFVIHTGIDLVLWTAHLEPRRSARLSGLRIENWSPPRSTARRS